MAITRTRKGKIVILSAREVKAETKRLTGWDDRTYNKEYDKLRNKYVNYKTITGSDIEYSVSELLLLSSRSKKKYGVDYRQSSLLRAIAQTTGQSTGRTKRGEVTKKQVEKQLESTKKEFSGFIGASSSAFRAEIEKIKEPAALLARLKQSANAVKQAKKRSSDTGFARRYGYE